MLTTRSGTGGWIPPPNKILTVETDHLSEEMVRMIVKNAGFEIEKL